MKQIIVIDENGNEPENMIVASVTPKGDVDVFLKGNVLALSLISEKIQLDVTNAMKKQANMLMMNLLNGIKDVLPENEYDTILRKMDELEKFEETL